MKGKRGKPPAPSTDDTDFEDAAPKDDLTRHSVMRTLYAPLTEAAKAQACDRMASLMGWIDGVEVERKAAMDACKEQREDFEGELSALAREVREGTPQEVPCTIERDYRAAMIRVWRVDTDAIIEERAMTPEELRRELELGGTFPVVPGAESDSGEAPREST
jgi:hypothetical protein